MTHTEFFNDVENALSVLKNGGVILYPTDTIWGIGCDATSVKAVNKILRIKQLGNNDGLVVLVAEERDILHYVAAPDLAVFDFLEEQQQPTTVVYEGAIHLPENVLAADGSVAIRIVQDEFCRHLIKRLRKPIVFAPANSSGQLEPRTFHDIDEALKAKVDYLVHWRQADQSPVAPSQIVRWIEGKAEWIEK